MTPSATSTPTVTQTSALTNSPTQFDTIGNFLLNRLHQLGLKHIFGVPGDFNLLFLDQIEDFNGIDWVGNCNELNAAYAADAYGRTNEIAALATTFGVGELSALNGIAGAFAERVPVVVITGSPASYNTANRALLHHSLGDGNYDFSLTAMRPITVAQAKLTPQNFVTEIDRCLTLCMLEKRPVYIQLPSDIATMTMPVPQTPLAIPQQGSDPQLLDAFIQKAVEKINEASSPVAMLDSDVHRFRLTEAVQSFIHATQMPFAVMAIAKGILNEKRPQYLGIYNGTVSKPSTRTTVERSDCLVTFGLRILDSTTAAFSHQIDADRQIEIRDWSARIGREEYYGIRMVDVLLKLTQAVEKKIPAPSPIPQDPSSCIPAPAPTEAPIETGVIKHSEFWSRIQGIIRSGDTLIAENGTSMSGVLALQLPENVQVISQPLWGSIGYTLPALLGANMAQPERRHLLFIGDGSFQLVAQELSTILRENLNPVIFLINNDGYTIERLIHGIKAPYNDIQPWNYSALCEVFANGNPFHSVKVTSMRELEQALIVAESPKHPVFIEVVMERMDSPESLKKLAPQYARQSYGLKWALDESAHN